MQGKSFMHSCTSITIGDSDVIDLTSNDDENMPFTNGDGGISYVAFSPSSRAIESHQIQETKPSPLLVSTSNDDEETKPRSRFASSHADIWANSSEQSSSLRTSRIPRKISVPSARRSTKAIEEVSRSAISKQTLPYRHVPLKRNRGFLEKLTSAVKRTDAILNGTFVDLQDNSTSTPALHSKHHYQPSKPSLKSKPKYSVGGSPNPSLATISSFIRRQTVAYDSSKRVTVNKSVEFDFGVDESQEFGHRYTIDKFKKKDIDIKQMNVEGKISLTKSYQDALMEAFGLKYLLTSELIDNDLDFDRKYAGLLKDHKINHDVFLYVKKSLEPNLSRAFNLLLIDPSLINIPLASAIDHSYGGMTLIYAALWFSDIRTFIQLLQMGANTRHKDDTRKKVREYIDKDSLRSNRDLRLKRILLSLYDEALKVIDMSFIIKDWRRIQLHVKSIRNFKLKEQGKMSSLPKTVFCSVSLDGRRQKSVSNDNHQSNLYFVNIDSVASVLDLERSSPYELLLNKTSERFSQYIIRVEIIMGNPGKGADKNKELVLLSSWSGTSNDLLEIATVEGTTGRFELVPAPGSLLAEGAQIELGEYQII